MSPKACLKQCGIVLQRSSLSGHTVILFNLTSNAVSHFSKILETVEEDTSNRYARSWNVCNSLSGCLQLPAMAHHGTWQKNVSFPRHILYCYACDILRRHRVESTHLVEKCTECQWYVIGSLSFQYVNMDMGK